jgi:hypothetical protein
MDRCKLCGAISIDGENCHPRCESGNLHHAGKSEPTIELRSARSLNYKADHYNRNTKVRSYATTAKY